MMEMKKYIKPECVVIDTVVGSVLAGSLNNITQEPGDKNPLSREDNQTSESAEDNKIWDINVWE